MLLSSFSVRVPEQCDAVVECYLLVDTPHETYHKNNTSHKDETTHKDMSDIGTNTDTDITSSELSEAVCEICQKRSQQGDSIAGEYALVLTIAQLTSNVLALMIC